MLQNKLNSHVARFTSHKSNCLEPNQVDAVCKKLMRKGESSYYFLQQNVTRFTAQEKLALLQVTYHVYYVTPVFRKLVTIEV